MCVCKRRDVTWVCWMLIPPRGQVRRVTDFFRIYFQLFTRQMRREREWVMCSVFMSFLTVSDHFMWSATDVPCSLTSSSSVSRTLIFSYFDKGWSEGHVWITRLTLDWIKCLSASLVILSLKLASRRSSVVKGLIYDWIIYFVYWTRFTLS